MAIELPVLTLNQNSEFLSKGLQNDKYVNLKHYLP